MSLVKELTQEAYSRTPVAGTAGMSPVIYVETLTRVLIDRVELLESRIASLEAWKAEKEGR